MEIAECSPAAKSASPPTALPDHCVQLSQEQYQALCDLRSDPLFKRALISPSSPPTHWDKLMSDKKHRNQCIVWMVHHYWLGSLKFALISKSVENAEKLYRDIFMVYQDLVLDLDCGVSPPRTRRLVFDHVGGGVFRLRVCGWGVGEGKLVMLGRQPGVSEEECRRKVRVLSAEALHVTRGSPWPKTGRSLHGHVGGLPMDLLEGGGVECSPEGLDEAMFGPESAAYRHELRRTAAYVAEQMEGRGERVDWDYLHVGAISEDLGSQHNLLSTLSKNLDDFLEERLPHT